LIFALSPWAHDDARHRVEHGLEDGTRLVWELLEETPPDAQVAAEVELGGDAWIARLDRVDFPPGGVAYRHVHPGPGIRRILHGELTIDRGNVESRTYRPGEAWFEGADDPVLATASALEETAFVRVLLLPAEWAGRRTIRYVDPADEDGPRLQRATVLLEEPLRA
jgi:quercetin dioxygenase-like cupin family protein